MQLFEVKTVEVVEIVASPGYRSLALGNRLLPFTHHPSPTLLQSSDVLHINTHRAMLFMYPTGEEIGAVHIKDLAEALVGFGEESGLEDGSLIFERDKLHGVALFSNYLFSGYGPCCNGYSSAHVFGEFIGRHNFAPTTGKLSPIKSQRVD